MGTELKRNKYELYGNKCEDCYAVDYYDIDMIMHVPEKCNRLDLVDYYVTLIDTINYHTHTGFTSIETLSKKCDIAPFTIVKYNKILRDNGIIYMVTSKKQGISNRYGLFKYRFEILKEAEKAGLIVDNKQ